MSGETEDGPEVWEIYEKSTGYTIGHFPAHNSMKNTTSLSLLCNLFILLATPFIDPTHTFIVSISTLETLLHVGKCFNVTFSSDTTLSSKAELEYTLLSHPSIKAVPYLGHTGSQWVDVPVEVDALPLFVDGSFWYMASLLEGLIVTLCLRKSLSPSHTTSYMLHTHFNEIVSRRNMLHPCFPFGPMGKFL